MGHVYSLLNLTLIVYVGKFFCSLIMSYLQSFSFLSYHAYWSVCHELKNFYISKFSSTWCYFCENDFCPVGAEARSSIKSRGSITSPALSSHSSDKACIWIPSQGTKLIFFPISLNLQNIFTSPKYLNLILRDFFLLRGS